MIDISFADELNNGFEKMMQWRNQIGYATCTYRSSIPPFINYCIEHYPNGEYITSEMLDAWLSYYNYSPNSRATFISLVREYSKFLCFLGRNDFIPDEDYSTKRIPYSPFIFTNKELLLLFDSLDDYKGVTCAKRFQPELVLPVYSRLLFLAGMRPNEPPALLKEDVDLKTGDVYIRCSKRHKDRHIIISDTLLELCNYYNELIANENREWFFQRWDGKPYETYWYYNHFQKCWERSQEFRRGNPRPYDLRHTFASVNLVKWLEEGKDAMELLPYLSAYMGHSEITSTLYYVHLLPDRLRQKVKIDLDQLAKIYGKEGIVY